MKVDFTRTDAPARKQVIFETIFAEKNGGGRVANSTFDLKTGMAVGLGENGLYVPIKGYKVVEDALSDATTLKIEKGSGVVAGDNVALAKKSVAVTNVDSSNDEFDTITISTLGVAIKKGEVLYQAKTASASAAAPVVEPVYILGEDIEANTGDRLVKLVNGANLRKESAPVAAAVVALMKSIELI